MKQFFHFSTHTKNGYLRYRGGKKKPECKKPEWKCEASQCEASKIVPTRCFADDSKAWFYAARIAVVSGVSAVGSWSYCLVTKAEKKKREIEKELRRTKKKEELQILKMENAKNHKETMEAVAAHNKRIWFKW